MTNKKCHTIGTISKSYIKIIKRGVFDNPNTLSGLGTGTLIKKKRGGGVN
jgi:hypothetical protein